MVEMTVVGSFSMAKDNVSYGHLARYARMGARR